VKLQKSKCKRFPFRLYAALILSVWSLGLFAISSDQKINQLLQAKVAPEGVVFEVITSHSGLKWAIPKVRSYVKLLRNKWPRIKIAVVSHGNEQFALTRANQTKFKQVHKQVKNLTDNLDIPVHICQTYAGMKGVSPEAFPKYITVSTHGPREVRNYQEFGYVRIVMTK